MTPLKLLAAAAGALLVAAYLPVFKLEDSPLIRALGTGARGWMIGVPIRSWHLLPLPAVTPAWICRGKLTGGICHVWETRHAKRSPSYSWGTRDPGDFPRKNLNAC